MSERAHPDDPGFKQGFVFVLKGGFFPWFKYRRNNPYLDAFRWRYQWVESFCQDKEVLDVPCGMGWGTSLIGGCKRLVGLDLSPESVAEARERYGHHARFEQGDMGDLAFEDESFDAVSCLEGIEHVPKEVGVRFLAEAARVLRPGGVLLLSSPHCVDAPHSGNPYHLHEYQPSEIEDLMRTHFDVECVDQRPVSNLMISYFAARKPL